MATIEEVNAKVDILITTVGGLANDQRKVSEDVAGIKAKLEVVPLHASPCEHAHDDYEEALDNLKRETGRWTAANTIGAIIAAILAVLGLTAANVP